MAWGRDEAIQGADCLAHGKDEIVHRPPDQSGGEQRRQSSVAGSRGQGRRQATSGG